MLSFTNVGIAVVVGDIILILMDQHFIVSTTDSMSPSLQSSLCTTMHTCQIALFRDGRHWADGKTVLRLLTDWGWIGFGKENMDLSKG